MATVASVLDSDIIEYLIIVAKIAGCFISVIIALIVYVWHVMERSVSKLETILTAHISEDDDTHDKLFTEIRRSGEKLSQLKGEHDIYKLNNGNRRN